MPTTTPAPPALAPTVPAPATAGSPPPARVHLGRRTRRVALIAHVLTSVGWFGVAGLVLFLLAAAQATGDDGMARSLARAVETSLWLSVPLGVAAATTGIVLGLGTKWGLARALVGRGEGGRGDPA